MAAAKFKLATSPSSAATLRNRKKNAQKFDQIALIANPDRIGGPNLKNHTLNDSLKSGTR